MCMHRQVSSLCSILSSFFPLLLATALAAQVEKTGPKATFENVAYGGHANQILDFWQAKVDEPAPLVVYIHGGGFTGGSHDKVSYAKIQRYLDANIHFASVEYRFLKHANFPAPHEDVVSALQFIRSLSLITHLTLPTNREV